MIARCPQVGDCVVSGPTPLLVDQRGHAATSGNQGMPHPEECWKAAEQDNRAALDSRAARFAITCYSLGDRVKGAANPRLVPVRVRILWVIVGRRRDSVIQSTAVPNLAA